MKREKDKNLSNQQPVLSPTFATSSRPLVILFASKSSSVRVPIDHGPSLQLAPAPVHVPVRGPLPVPVLLSPRCHKVSIMGTKTSSRSVTAIE